MEYLRTGLVPRFPTAILSTGLVLSGFFSFASGIILDTVTRGRRENKTLAYLAVPFPDTGADDRTADEARLRSARSSRAD
jgi:hypothetical protein